MTLTFQVVQILGHIIEPDILEETKEALRRKYEDLNPAELRRKILRLQKKLYGLATPVKGVTYE